MRSHSLAEMARHGLFLFSTSLLVLAAGHLIYQYLLFTDPVVRLIFY